MHRDDGAGGRYTIVIDPGEEWSDPPMTRSIERSLPWDVDRRRVAPAGDAGY